MRNVIIWLILFLFLMPFLTIAEETRGLTRVFKNNKGKEVGFYTGSYALLVGVSDYTHGWPDLTSIPAELAEVETTLKQNGFKVEKVINPNSIKLYDTYRNFINQYGYDKGNRLLFFFSGHGYSRFNGKKGYLVPTDAPDPVKNEKGFLRKALTMSDILTWARKMEAKHALFLFDSCFSGTIFKTRALPKRPPHISIYTSRPVRQFITAGSEGEEVPARSVFTPSFIRALRGSGDVNGDGYVTGTELGMYLTEKVLSYNTYQTPQYGKIRDPDLDEGDFVFSTDQRQPTQQNVVKKQESKIKKTKKILWKLDKGLTWLYIGDKLITTKDRTNSHYIGNDAIYYDKYTEDYYLLENHKNRDDNTLRPGIFLQTGSKIIWKINDEGTWLFVEGILITTDKRTNSHYIDNDVIYFDKQKDKYYFLKNYKNNNDNILRPGRFLQAGNKVIWKIDNGLTWLFVEGELITTSGRSNSNFIENDVIYYDKQKDKYYLLENYRNRADNTLRPGKFLQAGNKIIWKLHQGLTWLFVEGELITTEGRTDSYYVGNDVVYKDKEKGKSYLLENYKNSNDNTLRPGKIYRK